MKTLIIAEKPSLARDIASALGVPERGTHFESSGLIVGYCVGHLVEIYDGQSDSDRTKLPVIPSPFSLRVIKGKSDRFNDVKSLMSRSDVGLIVNACDAGREGEAIFRLVYEMAKCKKPTQRIWLQTMTNTGIVKAWNERVDSSAYDNLAHAARSRNEADWLFGMNGSRAAFSSLGRVMTPTLAMVCRAYLANQNFVSTKYWEIHGDFQLACGSYLGKWFSSDPNFGEDKSRFYSEKDAQSLLNKINNSNPSSVVDECKTVHSSPPSLFDLTSLQRESNKHFNFSAAKTLTIAQALYEKHKAISYPRTDSQHLPEDYVAKCGQAIELLSQSYSVISNHCNRVIQNNWVVPTKRIFNDGKISDHFAIIPTGIIDGFMSYDESLVYDLICRRFLAVFHPDAQFAQTNRTTTVQNEIFKSSGKVLLRSGWKEVYGFSDQDDQYTSLPLLTVGEPARTLSFEVKLCKTKAPALLNESSLLRLMEHAGKAIDDAELSDALKEKGIGTPATRAATIEKLKDTKGHEGRAKEPFVKVEKNFLIPTEKGLSLIAYLDRVYPGITSAALTGQWEFDLKQMESGHLSRSVFMSNIRDAVLDMVAQIQRDPPQKSVSVNTGASARTQFGICPLCRGGVFDYDIRYSCSCGLTLWKTIAGKKVPAKNMRQILDFGKTDLVNGFKSRAGNKFNARLKIDLKEKKITFDF